MSNMRFKFLLPLVAAAGCAASTYDTRVPIVAEVNRPAHVCIAGASLQPGDELVVRREVCGPTSPKITAIRCREAEAGMARVAEVAPDGCATVLVAADVVLRPGDKVVVARR